jgi:hypothetical protein
MTGRTAAAISTEAVSEETTPAAALAAGRTMASRSTPGSTAAGTTAVITAEGAGMTATTTNSPLKEERVVHNRVELKKKVYINYALYV